MYSPRLQISQVELSFHWWYNLSNTILGDGHKSYQLDVSDVESVSSVLKHVFNDYSSPPTIVVNAAGITRDNFLLKMSVQDFESVFNVNVKVRSNYNLSTFCRYSLQFDFEQMFYFVKRELF